MNDEVIPPGESPDQHLVSVADLPSSALSAIINKISQKTQNTSIVFRGNYSVSLEEIKNLIDKIRQEFHNTQPLSETLTISLHLSNNQRVDFTSWSEFNEFDKTQSARTKSLAFEYTRAQADSDDAIQRFRVQVACQNITSRFNLFFGPISISRAEDAGLPPVPIHATVGYSNYIYGKNLTTTIDSWVNALKDEEIKALEFLQKHSGYFPFIGRTVATIAAFVGCIPFLPNSATNDGDYTEFLFYAIFCIYIAYTLGHILSRLVERQIDKNRPYSTIVLTKGDESYDKKIRGKNKRANRSAALLTGSIALQILCSLAASYLYTLFSN